VEHLLSFVDVPIELDIVQVVEEMPRSPCARLGGSCTATVPAHPNLLVVGSQNGPSVCVYDLDGDGGRQPELVGTYDHDHPHCGRDCHNNHPGPCTHGVDALVVTDDSAFVVAINSYGFVQVLKLTVVTLEGGKTKVELEFVRSLGTYGVPDTYFGQPHLALRAVGGRQTLLVVASSHILEMELDGTFVRTIGFPVCCSRTIGYQDYLAALPLSGHIAAVDSNTKRVRIFDGESGRELVERAISIPSWGAPPSRWGESIYDGGVPTCDCARWKPRSMPMVEVDGQLVCSCQQCPNEYLNRPVAIAADASDQLIVLDLLPAGESDDNGNADGLFPCLRVFSATGELLSTRKSLFTAGWPSIYQTDGLCPKIEWVDEPSPPVPAGPR
jgi:hypothetical protein